MKIVKSTINLSELVQMAKSMGGMVKAMVDAEKGIIAIDAPMHPDLLEMLIKEENSEPKNL